ncbi:MAG: hypothetical protein WCK11_04255 [Candidatus Falkowbacteria bacterium]
MKNRLLINFFAILVLLVPFFSASAGVIDASKLKITPADTMLNFTEPAGYDASANLPEVMASIIQVFLSLLGIIFIVLIIYAGYNWMTASGDKTKVETAQQTITRAIIGLIIILAAYSITYFVFKSAGGFGVTGGGSGTTMPHSP